MNRQFVAVRERIALVVMRRTEAQLLVVGDRPRHIRDHEDRLDTDDASHTEIIGTRPTLVETRSGFREHSRTPARATAKMAPKEWIRGDGGMSSGLHFRRCLGTHERTGNVGSDQCRARDHGPRRCLRQGPGETTTPPYRPCTKPPATLRPRALTAGVIRTRLPRWGNRHLPRGHSRAALVAARGGGRRRRRRDC